MDPHSDLVDGGIPFVQFPWPLDWYYIERKQVIFQPSDRHYGDILLKHALLQRLVLVSASPSNGERPSLGTMCKF